METRNKSEYCLSEDVRRRSIKTPENINYLQDRLNQVMRSTGPISSYQDFLDEVSAFIITAPEQTEINNAHELTLDTDRLSKFILDKQASKVITPEDFKCVCIYLDWNNLFYNLHRGSEIAANFEDPLFHSILDFMKIGEFTLNNTKRHAPGLYRCYRPASTFPGNFWVGAMEITIAPTSGAVTTREFYQSGGYDGRPNKCVDLNGYLFRKGRHYSIISRDQASASLSVALLPSVTIEKHQITNLTGAVLDMSTGHLWGGRVIYDRVELPATCLASDLDKTAADSPDLIQQFFDSAKVCSAQEIPKSILHHFSGEEIPNLTLF